MYNLFGPMIEINCDLMSYKKYVAHDPRQKINKNCKIMYFIAFLKDFFFNFFSCPYMNT